MDTYRLRYLVERAKEKGLSALEVRRRERAADAKLLFILGTGRSGTHFLTRCLISHPAIHDAESGKEDPLVFKTISDAAADLTRAPRILKMALSHYLKQTRTQANRWFVDQTHPNIWFAEYWAASMPSARFLGIVRHPYSVIYSTLQHSGVRRWGEEWNRYPVPSPLLGLTVENRSRYEQMSTIGRYAVRWLAHFRRLESLKAILGERLMIMSYEDLCVSQQATLANIAAFLGIENTYSPLAVTTESLRKHAGLSSEQIKEIDTVLAQEGFDIETYRMPAPIT